MVEKTLATAAGADVAGGPSAITMRYERDIDAESRTVNVREIAAAGTDEQTTSSSVVDLASGLPVRTLDATERSTVTEYDSADRPVRVIDPAGHVTTTTYDGLVTRVTTADGVTTATHRNALGNVVTVANNIVAAPDGSPVLAGSSNIQRVIETREYENNAAKVTTVDSTGRTTVVNVDAFGRPVTTTMNSWLTLVNVYDDVANTVTSGLTDTPQAGLAGALRTTTQYRDDAGRDVHSTTTRKDGVSTPDTTSRFDGLGRTVSRSANDVATDVLRGADGTPKTTTTSPVDNAMAGETIVASRTHDMRGVSTNKALASSTGASAAGVTRVLDSHGRTVVESDQTGGVTRFARTPDGLVAEVTHEPSQTVTTNRYDAATRALLESVTTRPGSDDVRTSYEYDELTGLLLGVFDPRDRVGTEVRYGYDVAGNQTSMLYPDGKSDATLFVVHGRKVSSTDAAGNTTVYDYNEVGLLASATQTSAEGVVVGDADYGYDSFARMIRVALGNGVTTEYSYTSSNEVASETTTNNATRLFFRVIMSTTSATI